MGIFSKWIVLYRSKEKQAWRQKKEEFKTRPSPEGLREMYGGGFFQLRQISGIFGTVSDPIFVDLSDEDLQDKNSIASNGITIKTSGGSILTFNNDILQDSNAVDNVQKLMKITREPSQGVVDLREKLSVVDEIFGERIESVIAEVIGAVSDMDSGDRGAQYSKQVEKKHEMKLIKEGGVSGLSIAPQEVSTDEQSDEETIDEQAADQLTGQLVD